MARERVTAARALCMRGYLLTALFSVWINLIYGINIQLIPKNPVVNQSVTLRVSGVSGAILSFSWYGGLSDDDNMFLILTYNLSSYPVEKRGPLYIPGARGLPDGSLKISKLSTAYRGIFTVGIQAESFPTKGSIYLPVFELLTKPVISIASGQPEEYKEVTLLCSFRSDTARVFWSRIDGSIPSGVIYRANSRTMTIPRFSQSDVGQYQCEAENPISKNISDPYTLSLYYNRPNSNNCIAITVTIICGSILGTVLIICATFLLYKKYVLPLKGQSVDRGVDPSQIYDNIPNTAGVQFAKKESEYTGLQHPTQNTYSEMQR
eukprot:XP_012813365.1 PREDICTED: carcinoembryonic antigen-related cell adhesion molecule 1-like [Xenopus tropicalis]